MSRVERFSQRARRILTTAQDETDKLSNSSIETPHLLLAMLRVEDSVASRVLTDLKIDYERVLAVVRASNPAEPTPPKTHDLAPETKRLLESAMQLAQQRGDQFIGSEHLLLALVKGDDKAIRYLMRQINLEPAVVRSCVERVLQEGSDSLPATKPFTVDETILEESDPLKAQPELNARSRVLQLVESGKISAAEGAELLKAMRFAAIPVTGSSGFMLLPFDDVNFDDLRQRTVRLVISDKATNAVKDELRLPFERVQTELFRLLREIYKGSTGKLIDWDDDANHVEVTLD